MKARRPRWGVASFAALALGASPVAEALQPLSAFVAQSRSRSFDVREAEALVEQRGAEVAESRARYWPTLALSAGYTHNQYPSVASLPPTTAGGPPRVVTIVPQNQFDLTAQVAWNVLDVAVLRRVPARQAAEAAAKVRALATRSDVERSVVRAYYQLVGAQALGSSARTALAAADENAKVVKQRHAAGLAPELDVSRATAEIMRARQEVANADYTVSIAARSLWTLSGLEPEARPGTLASDDAPLAPLAQWEGTSLAVLPAVRAASADVIAAEKNVAATQGSWWPSLGVSASERFTNAVGFGETPSYTFGALLTWRLDASVPASVDVARAQVSAALVRQARARAAARDDIHNAWHRVLAQAARRLAARAQQDASAQAVRFAKARYVAGTTRLLEVIDAERDAFAAAVSVIQADAELATARAELRVAAGMSSAAPELLPAHRGAP